MTNLSSIRSQFPILAQKVNGVPLVYLDNAATTQKPQIVIDAVVRVYTELNANVHRGVHTLSERATEAFEGVRQQVAMFIGARVPEEIIFTSGTTQSVNALAIGWARPRLKQGDEILLTEMEHHSNIVPWQEAAKATGARVRYAGVTDSGRLDTKDLIAQLNNKTAIVSITAMSNVLGTAPPLKDIIKSIRKSSDAIIVVDGAQAASQIPLNVQSLDCDFLVFSGHKIYGPSGTGVLYGKAERLEEMEPYQHGSNMIADVTKKGSTWNTLPARQEAGTPNIAGVIGLGAAIDFLRSIGFDAIQEHSRALVAHALEMFEKEGVTVFGPRDTNDRGGVVSFAVGKIHAHDLASILDQHGVAVRSGHHCAQILMQRLGVPATARISASVYNTIEDIDQLAEAIREAKKILQ